MIQNNWKKDEYGNIKDDNGVSVCVTGFALSSGLAAQENTRLLLAAPALLEALEIARDYIYSELQEKKSAYGDRLQNKLKIIQDDLDKADLAIKQARGE